LHEDDHLARLGEGLDKFLKRLRADDAAGGGEIFRDELVGLFDVRL